MIELIKEITLAELIFGFIILSIIYFAWFQIDYELSNHGLVNTKKFKTIKGKYIIGFRKSIFNNGYYIVLAKKHSDYILFRTYRSTYNSDKYRTKDFDILYYFINETKKNDEKI